MKQIINPQETTRAAAFEMWMKSPQPMVTLGKTYDVTRLRKVSQRKDLKFNMLMSWCIGQAASQTDELYLQIDSGQLYRRTVWPSTSSWTTSREASATATFPIATTWHSLPATMTG